ncbi:MAG: hypothetical protein NTV81_02105 [Candidatus Komeilibacteria bacterium]|nr:hypothetical protein [Candidatus Komeilibacteria bacterium]
MALAKQLMGDVRSVILHQPAVYLKSVVGTAVIFFSPGSSHFSSQQNPPYNNYAILQNWDKFYGLFVYGEPLAWGGQKLLNYVSTAANIRPTQAWRFLVIGLFLTIIYLLGLVYGLIVVCRRKFFIKPDLPHDLIVGFLLFNIIYVTAIGILVEAGENQRHHLMIESFGWILLALILQKFVFDKRKIKS